MHSWQTFIQEQGIRNYTDDNNTRLHSSFEPHKTYLIALGSYGFLSVKGIDATKFLQGQVTCDVNALADNKSLLGAQCNLKGRMIGSFRLAQHENVDHILIRMPRPVLPHVHAALKKYSVFSRLELADKSESWHCMGLAGPTAAKLLQAKLQVSMNSDGECLSSPTLIITRLNAERYELWVQGSAAITLWQTLATSCTLGDSNFWPLLDIRAGLGDVQAQTIEVFTPQALNFQLTGAVNFKKGCYTGQEIVARLHYRGSLKKFMFLVQVEGSVLPCPGTSIHNKAGKKKGELVMAAFNGEGKIEALAVLPIDDSEPLFIANITQSFQRKSLPYAIPNADK